MTWQWGTWQNKMWGYDPETRQKHFVAYFWFVGWWAPINIGLHISFKHPNLELHIPFGFIRIGWTDGV